MELFKVLGIDPPQLSLKSSTLEKKFYELSMKYHPDRNRDGACSIDLSAKLNLAYKTLRDPWQRAEYVVSSSGLKIDSKVPHTLAEIYFELQDADSLDALRVFRVQLLDLIKPREAALQKAFEDYDREPSHQTETLKALKELVTERAYATSMLRDLETRLGMS